MIGDSDFGKNPHAAAEGRAWIEAVKIALSAYLLGFLSCVWLLWHMGIFSR